MAGWSRARTVVLEPKAEDAVDRLARELFGFEDAYMALEWLLARKAADVDGCKSRVVGGIEYCLYRQAADDMAETPEIVVLFTANEDEVVIIEIDAEEQEEELDD